MQYGALPVVVLQIPEAPWLVVHAMTWPPLMQAGSC
jgi:hypothetical protein